MAPAPRDLGAGPNRWVGAVAIYWQIRAGCWAHVRARRGCRAAERICPRRPDHRAGAGPGPGLGTSDGHVRPRVGAAIAGAGLAPAAADGVGSSERVLAESR